MEVSNALHTTGLFRNVARWLLRSVRRGRTGWCGWNDVGRRSGPSHAFAQHARSNGYGRDVDRPNDADRRDHGFVSPRECAGWDGPISKRKHINASADNFCSQSRATPRRRTHDRAINADRRSAICGHDDS